MLIYATADDLKNWLGLTDPPATANQLLRSASVIIRRETRAALYDVDSSGKPTDAEILQAFNDATCSQAALWLESGINPVAGGVDLPTPQVSSKSMGGRSVTYTTMADSVTIQQLRTLSAQNICTEAHDILVNAGLLNSQPGVLNG